MKNEFLENFKDRLIKTYTPRKPLIISEWIASHTNLKGKPFSFKDGYEFQRQICDDLHPNLKVKKISQVGLTELQLRKAIALTAYHTGTFLIYAMPNQDMRDRVSRTRMRPVIDQLTPDVADVRIKTTDLYQLNESFIAMLANVEGDATSNPADFLIIDEEDLSDQEILALYNSRLQASKFKIRQDFSTPTYTGYGISAEFEISDQREYMKKCEHCGKWQTPDFDINYVHIPDLPETVYDFERDFDSDTVMNLDFSGAYVKCADCGKPLDLTTNREWVAQYPSRTNTRGYNVRVFSTPMLSIRDIAVSLAEYKRKGFLRRGINTVLGRPYEDSATRLTEQEIEAVMLNPEVPDIGPDRPVFAGIDMGLTCHIVLGTPNLQGKICPFRFMTVHVEQLGQTIEDLRKRYNWVFGLVDRYPYTPTANELRDKHERLIVPAVYQGEKDYAPTNNTHGDLDYYNINRTFMADLVANSIRYKEVSFEGYSEHKAVLKAHLRDTCRELTTDGKARWLKLTGNDHFFHALVYLNGAYHIKQAEKTVDSPRQLIQTTVCNLKYFEQKSKWLHSIR